MSKESFISYKNYFWLWVSLALVIVCTIAYLLDDPIGGRNGGTVLGYTLGVLSTIGIIYLMWYGIRKRSYYSKMTTLKGVLSSHIWIGIALVIIVPLHSGFSFNLNVHTLTYLVMLLTIFTGIWGVFLFRSYPQALHSQRGGASLKQIASSLYNLTNDIDELVNQDKQTKSDAYLSVVNKIYDKKTPSFWQSVLSKEQEAISQQALAKELSGLNAEEQNSIISLIGLANKKQTLESKLKEEAKAHTIIRGWLFLHVPLSIGLCVLLFVHIVSVFYYW